MSYTHTVIGVFESDYAAQDAVDALINKGFDRSEIEERNHRDISGHPEKGTDPGDYHGPKKESALSSFFGTIFGNNQEDADKHYRVVSRGGAIVTVYAKNQEEAMRASDVLDDNGAIDVDEVASKYASESGTNYRETYVPGSNQRSATGEGHNPIITKHEDEYAKSSGGNRIVDEDRRELPRVEERSGPGVGTEPTAGKRSKSRINEWQGEASARLREDRDSETKIGW